MIIKNCNRTYLLLLLIISSFSSWAQDCDSLSFEAISDPGIYSVVSLTEADGIRNGPDYSGATIYYPLDATPPFTGIAIVPGYLSPQLSIQEWGPYLASHGIVAMTIGTNSIFDNPYGRRDALLDAIITLKEENTRSDSPLFGNLDIESMAVGGWSMGGGGAQLAATADPTLKAVVALCPWLDPEQLTAEDINHTVPTLIFSGENDAVAPPASHADVHYDYTLETTNKLIYEIENGDHFVANSPEGGEGEVGKIAVSWLNYFLVEDICYCPFFIETPATASNYMTNVVCSTTPNIIHDIENDGGFLYQLYPNPSSGFINLEGENMDHRSSYEITTLLGEKISQGPLLNDITSIDIQNLPSGVYFMKVYSLLYSEKIKFIVL